MTFTQHRCAPLEEPPAWIWKQASVFEKPSRPLTQVLAHHWDCPCVAMAMGCKPLCIPEEPPQVDHDLLDDDSMSSTPTYGGWNGHITRYDALVKKTNNHNSKKNILWLPRQRMRSNLSLMFLVSSLSSNAPFCALQTSHIGNHAPHHAGVGKYPLLSLFLLNTKWSMQVASWWNKVHHVQRDAFESLTNMQRKKLRRITLKGDIHSSQCIPSCACDSRTKFFAGTCFNGTLGDFQRHWELVMWCVFKSKV